MIDQLEIPPFLDRRHEHRKGDTVTEQPKSKRVAKERNAVLRLVVEYERDTFDMECIKELVEKARETGTIRSAKVIGLPTSMGVSDSRVPESPAARGQGASSLYPQSGVLLLLQIRTIGGASRQDRRAGGNIFAPARQLRFAFVPGVPSNASQRRRARVLERLVRDEPVAAV